MKDFSGKLEGTVGNDNKIKEANRYVADLASYQGAQVYEQTLRDMFKDSKYASLSETDGSRAKAIAMELGFDEAGAERAKMAIQGIANGNKATITDLNAARDAADERLKTAKKDAVSRKLAEAHASGIDNDTSRMA